MTIFHRVAKLPFNKVHSKSVDGVFTIYFRTRRHNNIFDNRTAMAISYYMDV